jgi:hypothetical protein
MQAPFSFVLCIYLIQVQTAGRAEWIDKSHKKCLILWLRIQDWANYILDFVRLICYLACFLHSYQFTNE